MRRSYGCPCAGEQHPPDRDRRIADAEYATIRAVMGESPDGCPWAGFADPDVAAVLHAFEWDGQLAIYLGPDPERWLIDGITHYRRAHRRAKADAIRLAKANAKRPRARLPANFEIEDVIRG